MSAFGTTEKSRDSRVLVAIGGKADNAMIVNFAPLPFNRPFF
jgi:hypothetical protein